MKNITLGFHVRKGNSFEESFIDSIQLLDDYGVQRKVFQLFVMNPKCGNRKTVDHEDSAVLKSLVASGKCRIFAHSSYSNVPWGHNSDTGLKNIVEELRTCSEIGIEGLVVHLSAAANNEGDFLSATEKMYEVDYGVPVYLEINPARRSDNTFETAAKLAPIFERASKAGFKFGLCIDTAHLWSCGVDVSSVAVVHKWLRSVSKLIDKYELKVLLHLNDSNVERGIGVDRHAGLRNGFIWDNSDLDDVQADHKDSLYLILKWARDKDVCIILERDEASIIGDINVIKNMQFI